MDRDYSDIEMSEKISMEIEESLKKNITSDNEKVDFLCELHKDYLDSSGDNRSYNRLKLVHALNILGSKFRMLFALKGAEHLPKKHVKTYVLPKSKIEALEQICDFIDPDNSNKNFDKDNLNSLSYTLNNSREIFQGSKIGIITYYKDSLIKRLSYIYEDRMTRRFSDAYREKECLQNKIKELKLDEIENQSRAAKDCSSEESDAEVIKNYISGNPEAKKPLRSLLNLAVGFIADKLGNDGNSTDRSELVENVISTLEEQYGVSLTSERRPENPEVKPNSPKPQM